MLLLRKLLLKLTEQFLPFSLGNSIGTTDTKTFGFSCISFHDGAIADININNFPCCSLKESTPGVSVQLSLFLMQWVKEVLNLCALVFVLFLTERTPGLVLLCLHPN